jgi:hypothetical protein
MLASVGGGTLILSATGLLVFGPGQILSVALAKMLAVGFYIAGGLLLTMNWR